ncbi:MAG: gliding motility-associated C-terminal domain-containing protein, partial [Chitinophagales bacterium]|nr:gliding motility-associated C-terminal domain-containing protein [Chitinophagales bacterium]
NGCVVNNQVTVNAALPIIAEFPRDTFYVDLGHQTQLTLNIGNLDSTVIEWSSEKTPDYLNFTCGNCSELSPVSSTPFTNNYFVKVYDKENPSCYKTASVSVIVSNEVAIPNVFTPNADNVNDKFYPVFNNKEVKLREFKIYNRWGQIVHQEATMGWDGTFESIQQPVGSYKYFIVYEKLNTSTGKTELKNRSGTFTLLR